MKGLGKTKKLSKELVDAAIDQVVFYKGGAIELKMKYHEIFEKTRHEIDDFCRKEGVL